MTWRFWTPDEPSKRVTYSTSTNVKAVWVYLVPTSGDPADCQSEGCPFFATAQLVALDEEGAGPVSPALCSLCLLERLVGSG